MAYNQYNHHHHYHYDRKRPVWLTALLWIFFILLLVIVGKFALMFYHEIKAALR